VQWLPLIADIKGKQKTHDMKTLLHRLLKRKLKSSAVFYNVNKPAMAKPLKPVPSFWLLVPVTIEDSCRQERPQ
jgi:hypothetical protein